jgi:hypothetical protein
MELANIESLRTLSTAEKKLVLIQMQAPQLLTAPLGSIKMTPTIAKDALTTARCVELSTKSSRPCELVSFLSVE